MNVVKTIKVVKVPDNDYWRKERCADKWIKDHEYSQGYFSAAGTDDIFHAKDFTGKEYLFETFFAKRDAKLIEFTFTATEREQQRDEP